MGTRQKGFEMHFPSSGHSRNYVYVWVSYVTIPITLSLLARFDRVDRLGCLFWSCLGKASPIRGCCMRVFAAFFLHPLPSQRKVLQEAGGDNRGRKLSPPKKRRFWRLAVRTQLSTLKWEPEVSDRQRTRREVSECIDLYTIGSAQRRKPKEYSLI